MKFPIHVATLLCAGLLAGCAQQGRVGESEYVPEQGGPGYGTQAPGGNVNAVPGQRPAESGAQGSGGTGVTGSGTPGAYGTGESGSAASMGGAAGSGQGASSTGAATGSNQQVCAMYGRMMGARTPEERQSLMEQMMPGMSAASRQQHLEMMRRQCE